MNPCARDGSRLTLIVMNRFVLFVLFCFATTGAFAQDAATVAAQREAEERERRMNSTVEELRRANSVQQVRIGELREEVGALRRQVIELENRFKNSQIGAVNSQDIRKVYDKMAEMEKARDADKKLVIEQMKKIEEIASKPPIVIQTPAPARPEPKQTAKPDHTPTEPEMPEFTGEYYPYKIQPKDTLLGIIAAFNAQLKEKGKAPITLEQVRKANPKLNPNNLLVGREIRIPEPPNK
jgi:TolA-binding protein